jgi:integrase
MSRGRNKDTPYKSVTHGTIRKYLDKRAAEGAPVQGNREVSYLSAVYTWAIQRDLLPRNYVNPCHQVARNKEQHRKRYVEDGEYFKVMKNTTTWYLPALMEHIYLCRFRPSEALGLTKADVLNHGLDTRRTKGSNDAITKWSDRLATATNVCLAHERDIHIFKYLYTNKAGGRVTLGAAEQALTRAIKKAGVEPFTLHDLKAKGVSDVEDAAKQAASGHKDSKTVAIYDRKKKEVDATK